jgi:UPF0755 protein
LKKKVVYIVAVLFIISGIFGYSYYQKIFGNAITKEHILFVKSTDSLLDVQKEISAISKNSDSFLWVAAKKNFLKPKAGRYVIAEGMSNNDLINMLRIGRQTPFKLSFNNQDTLEKLAGRVSTQVAADSVSLLANFHSKYL